MNKYMRRKEEKKTETGRKTDKRKKIGVVWGWVVGVLKEIRRASRITEGVNTCPSRPKTLHLALDIISSRGGGRQGRGGLHAFI